MFIRQIVKVTKSLLTVAILGYSLPPCRAAAMEPVGGDVIESMAAAGRAGFQLADQGLRLEPKIVSRTPWQQILDKVRAKGKFSPRDGDIPATKGLEYVRGRADADHVVDYINIWGDVDSRGAFAESNVTMVSEDWRIGTDGNWHIDQWIFETDLEGATTRAAHNALVETRDGRVLGYDNENLPQGDPRVRTKYDSLISLWTAFQP